MADELVRIVGPSGVVLAVSKEIADGVILNGDVELADSAKAAKKAAAKPSDK